MIAPAERSVHGPESSLHTRQMSSHDTAINAAADPISVAANTRAAVSPSAVISGSATAARSSERPTGKACAIDIGGATRPRREGAWVAGVEAREESGRSPDAGKLSRS